MSDTPWYHVRQDAGPPPSTSGRKSRWGHLPLSEIEVGDVIELPMDENESASVISALSSYVWRESNKIGKKFSVKRVKLGIGIWRTQ